MCHQNQKEDPSNSNIPELNSALVIMCEYLIVQSGSNTGTMLELHKQTMDLSSFLLSNSLTLMMLSFFSSEVQMNRIQDEEIRERTSSFGRSVSDSTRQRLSALALSTSRSENAISKYLVSGSTGTQRSLNTSNNSPTVEKESSPESTGTKTLVILLNNKINTCFEKQRQYTL